MHLPALSPWSRDRDWFDKEADSQAVLHLDDTFIARNAHDGLIDQPALILSNVYNMLFRTHHLNALSV